ncbi:MAG: magnesium transporter [Dehalococcoidia bacterium]
MAQQYRVVPDELPELLAKGSPEEIAEALDALHPADQAGAFAKLEPSEREQVLALLRPEDLARLIEHLDEESREELVAKLPRAVLARVLDYMTSDEAADVLQELPPAEVARLLASMETAGEVAPLLRHAPESAGGLMTRGYVALHHEMTVQEAINYLRLRQPAAQDPYYLYVLDAANRLQGIVSLRELIIAEPATRIPAIMTTEVVSVPPGTDQEECARLIQRYRFRTLPVVDEDGVLQGIVTIDDLIDVVTEEATEDMYRMAGVGVKEWAFSPLRESIFRRVPWLAFNMVWAFAGALVISLFKGTLEQAAAVAIFMPMIAGQAGNAGIQTATIVVRSMALGEVQTRDAARLLAKELAMGAIKGALFGAVLGLIAWLWQGNPTLGIVAGAALFLNMLVAATCGVLVPMTMRRLGFDPATIAGVFDTMLTDLMGFVIYLGLATAVVSHLD